MTENEAKGKECCGPESCGAFKYDGISSPMRMPVTDEFGRQKRYCTGSACMAWRWWVRGYQGDGVQVTTLSETDHGYCGIAGRPGPS